MTAAHAPLTHFEAMTWLLKELEPSGIELHDHQFSPAVVGSFVVLFGRGKKEVRLTWDGRDALLSVDFRQNSDESWTHDANISVPQGEGLYAELATQATGILAV